MLIVIYIEEGLFCQSGGVRYADIFMKERYRRINARLVSLAVVL